MMDEEFIQMLDENLVYFATSTRDGKPNVVPIGLCHAINSNQIIIVDVLFNKTRKNLEENPQVAISFTDVKRWESYQLKGKAEIYTDGPIFDQMLKIREQKEIQNRARTGQLVANNPELMKKAEQLKKWRRNLKPKAVVLITVEEIYSHMPKLDND